MSRLSLPTLTVVIAASDSTAAVSRTLASLGPIGAGVEVIVSAPRDTMPRPALVAKGVVWLSADHGLGVPWLRRLGLDRARGEIVAFTEDSCLLAPGWSDAWRAAFADPRVVAASGPVVPAMGGRPLDWAVFFCEYAPFLPGAPSSRLAGNNFAVRRERTGDFDPKGVHESDLHDAPAFVVLASAGHARRYSLAAAIRDRLRFGAEYGRRRASTLGATTRLAGLFVGPLILLAQLTRLTLNVARRRGYMGPFLETLPLTLALLTAWSVGEWIGWASAAVFHRRRERAARAHAREDAPAASPRPRYTRGQPIA